MEILPPRLGNDTADSIETLKAESRLLRGSIAQELCDPCDHFSEPTALLLRQHGVYQQVDRDRHGHLGDPGFRSQTVYQFMIRAVVPGGRLNCEQFSAMLTLADEFGGGRLKVTWRQNLELHGVSKQNLVAVIRRIHAAGLSTLAACGDTNRNVICCPAPYRGDPVHDQIYGMARAISAELTPQTAAYREIWLGDVPFGGGDTADTVEPLYGPTYLPNKLKIAISLPGDNCTDVFVHDIGLLAICENFNVVGYNVLVGGGMEVSDGSTQPALAQPLGFVWAGEALNVVRAIVKVYRDFGDRTRRSRSRLRHLVDLWGVERMKAQVEAYCGQPLAPSRNESVWNIDDHLGWHEQGDGRWFYGIHLPGGRIEDTHRGRWKSGLRDICAKYSPTIYLTTGQNVLIGDIRWEDRLDLEDHLRRNELRSVDELSNCRRWSVACVSLPTCPFALTESDRALPGLLDQLELELIRLGLQGELFSLRMSGCGHGCTRPNNADIGIIGRGAGRYAIILGGRRLGDRIGFLYRDGVPFEEITSILAEVFGRFQQARKPGEQLGDFCYRVGLDGLNRPSF